MLNGIKNFVLYINENWTTIVVILAAVFALYERGKAFFNKSKDEQIAIAKNQIKESMLKLVMDSETEYAEWEKAGAIKRSQVIRQIYTDYPILGEIVDQGSVIKWLDGTIDDALKTLRQVIKENANKE